MEKIANGLEIKIHVLFLFVDEAEPAAREINNIVNLCNERTKQVLQTIAQAIYNSERGVDETAKES